MQYCLAPGHVFSPENIPVKPPAPLATIASGIWPSTGRCASRVCSVAQMKWLSVRFRASSPDPDIDRGV